MLLAWKAFTLKLVIPTDLSPGVPAPSPGRTRIPEIDLIRGLVMVLMAIDHVRVYSGLPAGGPTAGIFFTRWITHFCAPVFAFLAGTSAYLYGQKLIAQGSSGTGPLMRHLAGRGLLLVVLELTLVRFLWTFNLDYGQFTLAGVLWMLGWCMVLLALFVPLPPRIAGLLGVAIIVLQNLFAIAPHALPATLQNGLGPAWEFLYPAGLPRFDGIAILYVLVPWIGVMASGYAYGAVMTLPPERRRKISGTIGAAALLLFLGFASFQALHSTASPPRPFLFQLLDQRKYPASPLYLLMTLSPMFLCLAVDARRLSWQRLHSIGGVLTTFGRVPLFYYVLHIPVIHVAALLVTWLREGAVHPEWYATAPFTSIPREHQWSLALLYAVFFAVMGVLYAACRLYAQVLRRPAFEPAELARAADASSSNSMPISKST